MPDGWEFPSRISVKTVWDLWFFGDKNSGIRSLRLISRQHDVQAKHAMRHTRLKAVMDALETIAMERNLFPSPRRRVSDLSIEQSDEMFVVCFRCLLETVYESAPKRPGEISCGAVYNRLCGYRNKQAQTDTRHS